MSTLGPAPTICFYNGVTWPTETETIAVSIKPVSDSAGRAVKYVLYNLTLRSVFGQDNQERGETTDLNMAAIRIRLTQFAGELHYEAVGMGNLAINIPAGVPTVGVNSSARDAIWGPKPTLMVYKPLGQNSADVTWSVEVAIPECDLATYTFATMEWCWKLSWTLDRGGLTTRTHMGHVSIPQTRATVNARNLADHADRLREQINPPLIPGFRRIPGRFDLSEDKCRLDWSITDEEFPSSNYPPAGVVEVQASHTLTTSKLYSGLWKGSLTATYELSRDKPRAAAEAMFSALVADRIVKSRGQAFKGPGGVPRKSVVIFKGYEESEPEIYGRRSSAFRAEYTLSTTLEELARISGLWRPLAGSDSAKWAQSLANVAFNCRGNAKLKFDPSADAIVDLCEPANYPQMTSGKPPSPGQNLKTSQLKNELPDAPTSWLVFYSSIRLEQIDQTVSLQTLRPDVRSRQLNDRITSAPERPHDYTLTTTPGERGTRAVPDDGLDLMRVGPVAQAPAPAPAGSAGGHIIQVRAPSTWYAYLTGFAIRAGYLITPPALVSVGGAKAVQANREGNGFRQGTLGSWFGLAIHTCEWDFRYLLETKPVGDLPVLDNPFLGG